MDRIVIKLVRYALFPIRADGSRGKEKNFFSREKAERRHRSFLLSPNPQPFPVLRSLVRRRIKKSGVFCKVKSSPLLEINYPYGEQSLQKKRGILGSKISTLLVIIYPHREQSFFQAIIPLFLSSKIFSFAASRNAPATGAVPPKTSVTSVTPLTVTLLAPSV